MCGPKRSTRELAGLQDEVPSVPQKEIRKVIARELGSVEKRYRWLADTPIAAALARASLSGQLHNGDRVVVKVQRPASARLSLLIWLLYGFVAWVANQFQFIRRRADMADLDTESSGVCCWKKSLISMKPAMPPRFADDIQR